MTDVSDFQRESYRIDEQIWDALALRSGERALFLGLANEGAWVARAMEIGVDVTVLSVNDAQIALIEKLGASAMRGSATMIPATENAYDVAVAMHYLHEIDPGFHGQVVAELARVGKRVAIVEPSPPADPLGKRIAALYARAKREGGQFESYQPLEYWRKLLSVVKGDVWQNLFTFTRVPPKYAVSETVSLILDAMAIEEMPKAYLDELRELAAQRDAQLLPLSRIVLVGVPAGVPLPQGSGSAFRPNVTPAPPPPPPRETPAAIAPAPPAPPPALAPYQVIPSHDPAQGFGFAAPDAPSPRAFAPNAPAPAAPATAASPPASAPAGVPGANVSPTPPPPITPAAPPFGAPFALPGDDEAAAPFGGAAGEPKTGFGWAWEPPEEGQEPS
jgi:hypothetical protein